MTDQDLIAQFLRTVPSAPDGGTVIEVCEISWPHPHEPEGTWVTVTELPAGASQERIDRQISKILRNRKYFRVCQECGERKPVGWMHNARICQGCAEKHHGVCY